MEPDTHADVGGYEGVKTEGKIMSRMAELGFVEVGVDVFYHCFRCFAAATLISLCLTKSAVATVYMRRELVCA